MRIILEIEDERDANLVISLTKRLKGKILEGSKSTVALKKGKTISHSAPFAKNGRTNVMPGYGDWQRNQIQYWEL